MMTREEAIEYAESKKMRLEALVYNNDCKYGNYAMYSSELSFVNAALTALRPVSREQVERIWGTWEPFGGKYLTRKKCSRCGWDGQEHIKFYSWCPNCGSPMTDEAVEMVMERLEALHEIPPTT